MPGRQGRCRRVSLVWLALAAIVMGGGVAVGPSGSSALGQTLAVMVPSGPSRCPVRLRLIQETTGAPGYHRYRIVATTATGAPAVRDHAIQVRLGRLPYGYVNNSTATVPVDLVLPRGQITVTEDVLVPIPEAGQTYIHTGFQATVDGRFGNDLTQSIVSYAQPLLSPTLIVDPAVMPREDLLALIEARSLPGRRPASTQPSTMTLPNVAVLGSMLQEHSQWNSGMDPSKATTDFELLQSLSPNGTSLLRLVQPASLPTNWLALSAYRRIVIPFSAWRELRQSDPERAQALSDWTRMGGALIVWGLTEAEHADLTATFPFSPETPRDRWMRSSGVNVEETILASTSGRTSGWLESLRGVPEGRSLDPWRPLDAAPPKRPPNATLTYDGRLLTRKLHFGTVLAVLDDAIYDNSRAEWATIFQASEAADAAHWAWLWGDPSGGSSTFWSQRIPSVGGTPVLIFLSLIVLFVIAIGPINYIVLRRNRRMAWMLVTVPGGALVMVTGLAVYAVAHDGFHTRTRVHSVTMLDAQTRQASTLSLQTYYSGLAPAGGLVFSDRTAVYPLTPTSITDNVNHYERRPERLVTWDDGRQRWAGESLPSRSQQLYSVGLPQEWAGTLAARPTTDGTGVEIVNTLGTTVRFAFAVNAAGELVACQSVPHDGRATLTTEAAPDTIKKTEAAWNDARPSTPLDLSRGQMGALFGRARNTNLTMGAMDTLVTRLPRDFVIGLGRPLNSAASPGSAWIPPGCIVAVLEDTPDLPRGLSSTADEASFHLLITGF